MTEEIHYDLLRDRRVQSKDELVVGRHYLICHVPMDNPYTSGVNPHCSEKKIVDLQFLSSNDIEMGQKGMWRNNPDIQARMRANESLEEKHWMFRTEEDDFRPGVPYINWYHVSTYIDHTYNEMNFLLDLEKLSEEGIKVIRTTSVPFVISEELREERDVERELYLSGY